MVKSKAPRCVWSGWWLPKALILNGWMGVRTGWSVTGCRFSPFRSLLAGRQGREGKGKCRHEDVRQRWKQQRRERREGRLACGAVTVEACTTSATVDHSRGATRCVSCLAGWPLHPCYGHPRPPPSASTRPTLLISHVAQWVAVGGDEGGLASSGWQLRWMIIIVY